MKIYRTLSLLLILILSACQTLEQTTPALTPIQHNTETPSPITTPDYQILTNHGESKNVRLENHASVTIPIDVDTSATSAFMLGCAGMLPSDLPKFTITRPDGKVIDEAYTVAHPSEVAYHVEIGGFAGYIPIYYLKTTLPGTWQVNLTSTVSSIQDCGISISMQGGVKLSLTDDEITYHPGETATITARLSNNGASLTSATVAAFMRHSGDAPDELIGTISLLDQGDGSYTASYPIPNQVGSSVSVDIIAQGKNKDGKAYTRQGSMRFSIQTNLQVTKTYRETPNDTDGDGKYETLDFHVGVDTTAPTTYSKYLVSAELYSSNGIVAYSPLLSLDLPAGKQTITIPFDGEDIQKSGEDGPYTVSNLIAIPVGSTHIALREYDVLKTAAYTHKQFGRSNDCTITGHVITDHAGQAGVFIKWIDELSRPRMTITNTNGYYAFAVPANWSGIVKPETAGYFAAVPINWTNSMADPKMTDYAFTPESVKYTNLGADQNDQNYTTTSKSVTIRGNTGLAGVSLYLFNNGTQITKSDSHGNYLIILPFGWAGTIAPSLPGYTFRPASMYYNLSEKQTKQNYIVVHTIFGNVGKGGVSLKYEDDGPRSVESDAYGNYALTVSDHWSGTITLSLPGYTNKTYTDVTSDLGNENYTAPQ